MSWQFYLLLILLSGNFLVSLTLSSPLYSTTNGVLSQVPFDTHEFILKKLLRINSNLSRSTFLATFLTSIHSQKESIRDNAMK